MKQDHQNIFSPSGYAGQYTDPESGLVYMRARYYDPGTGTFLTRDPLEAQTREPYGYVGGNPLNATDPLGLCWGPGCWVRDHWKGALQVVGGTAAVVGVGACLVVTEWACAFAVGRALAYGAGAVVTAGAGAMAVSAGHDMYDLARHPEHYQTPGTASSQPSSCDGPSFRQGGPTITSGSPSGPAPSFWEAA